MSRIKGTTKYNANFEMEKSAPLEDMYCETYADMLNATEQESYDGTSYLYDGKRAIVFKDTDTTRNGTYILVDFVNPTLATSWEKVNTGNKDIFKVIAFADSDIDLTTGGLLTIDGVNLVANDRVACFNQTTFTEDGIYIVNAGAWTRATDYIVGKETSGDLILVTEGTINEDTLWVISNNDGGDVVGTNDLLPIKLNNITGAYEQQFTNADLVAGVLSVYHNLGEKFTPVALFDNNGNLVTADEVTPIDNDNLDVDLTSFGTIGGTWTVKVIGGINKTSGSFIAHRGIGTTITATSYTFKIEDRDLFFEASNGSAQSLTIPPNSSVGFPLGTEIEVMQSGLGEVSFVAGTGVTINSKYDYLSLDAQYSSAILKKLDTDRWALIGDLA